MFFKYLQEFSLKFFRIFLIIVAAQDDFTCIFSMQRLGFDILKGK